MSVSVLAKKDKTHSWKQGREKGRRPRKFFGELPKAVGLWNGLIEAEGLRFRSLGLDFRSGG